MEVTFSLSSGDRHQARVRAVLPSTEPTAKSRFIRLDPAELDPEAIRTDNQIVTVYLPN
jgi:hypothetical protein